MTKSKTTEGTELTPYRTHQRAPSIFEEKFKIAQQKLINNRKEREKEERKQQEQEQQNILKKLSLLKEINEVIYPLELKITTNKSWDRSDYGFTYSTSVSLYSSNLGFYPQYVCSERHIIDELPHIIEKSSFAELVEDFSNPNLKRIKKLHGPLPREIIIKRVKIVMLTILTSLSLFFLI